MENKRDLLLESVAHEVKMLKQHATPEEIKRLNLTIFNPDSRYNCIYGQMTHDCSSERAKELMDVACDRVWDLSSTKYMGVWDLKGGLLDERLDNLNGNYEGQPWDGEDRRFNYLSALEGYICLKDAKVSHIIDYLKDTENKIELNLVD